MNPIISIIIPTLNRAHLIGETLDTIVNQSYTHWECIIVDDGSTDHTEALVQSYIEKDDRFTFFRRPESHKAGGNGARNYGLLQARGTYVQWFDSDDLMDPDKLKCKIETLKEHQVDFVISKTKYFNKKESRNTYNYLSSDINFINYATGSVAWFTPDVFVKKSIVEGLFYNETLKAGQEYNFICKLLLRTYNAVKVDEFLSFRRFHEGSIGHQRKQDKNHHYKTKFEAHWQTFLEVHAEANSPKFNRYSLSKCLICYFWKESHFPLPKGFTKAIMKVYKWKSIWFFMAMISYKITGKYHHWYKKLK